MTLTSNQLTKSQLVPQKQWEFRELNPDRYRCKQIIFYGDLQIPLLDYNKTSIELLKSTREDILKVVFLRETNKEPYSYGNTSTCPSGCQTRQTNIERIGYVGCGPTTYRTFVLCHSVIETTTSSAEMFAVQTPSSTASSS